MTATMKWPCITFTLAVAAEAAYHANLHNHIRQRSLNVRQSSISDDDINVPAYNFTMPVDHFDTTNKDTYPNRYFVNDTYYKAGGPVIFFDNGEAAFEPRAVSDFLTEARWPSLPMQLAANLSALVIGWEHRYYGYSRPVEIDDESGFPQDGAKGYKYLSVEQALEDVAYFANRFNQTKLDKNHNVQSTSHLDPYNTPWIFIGGSYPGSRAAWMRVKYPEIIYASWASSAPLQYQVDGSSYFNPIMRSMAQNCTNDIKAAVGYIDQVFTANSSDHGTIVKIGAHLLGYHTSLHDIADAQEISDFMAARLFARSFTVDYAYQGYGAKHTTQTVCDMMQTFDVDQYAEDMNNAESAKDQARAMIDNPGNKEPSPSGISAQDGGAEYAVAALIYGVVKAKKKFNEFVDSITDDNDSEELTPNQDYASWEWQVISQLGVFQGSNPDNITSISKYYNFTAVENIQDKKEFFGDFDPSELPKSVYNKGILDFGGWKMEASNVMFANGEFDPWRAFGVASQEESSPKRRIVQNVPDCNKVSSNGDAFGLIYPGAVHAEDVLEFDFSGASLVDGKTPQKQGMELFLEAWNVWAPCFNQSRDSVRNGKGVDGKGNDASGKPMNGGDSSNSSGAVGVRPLSCTAILAALMALFVCC